MAYPTSGADDAADRRQERRRAGCSRAARSAARGSLRSAADWLTFQPAIGRITSEGIGATIVSSATAAATPDVADRVVHLQDERDDLAVDEVEQRSALDRLGRRGGRAERRRGTATPSLRPRRPSSRSRSRGALVDAEDVDRDEDRQQRAAGHPAAEDVHRVVRAEVDARGADGADERSRPPRRRSCPCRWSCASRATQKAARP